MRGDGDGLLRHARRRGLTGLTPVGRGLEFTVHRATTGDGEAVVLRTPTGGRYAGNANDPTVDTRALLRWEYAATDHLSRHGLPVARPYELVLGDPDLLVAGYLPDDGGPVPQAELGAALGRLHALPPPPDVPADRRCGPDGGPVPARITHRWRTLATLVDDLPEPIGEAALRAALTGRRRTGLLHLDVRAANLRRAGGRLTGIVDWSNALVGDPDLEWARLAEFARLPDNGIDFEAVLAAGGHPLDRDSSAFWVYRLDAAVMLAVVFLTEAPDDRLGRTMVDRLRHVHEITARKVT
jgi:aminoglycoside phosphotransferase (APT) family kinase protein